MLWYTFTMSHIDDPLHISHHLVPKHPFGVLHHTFFFGLLFAGLALFGYIVSPFIVPLFWAVVFAIILHPLQEKIKHLSHTYLHTRMRVSNTLASLLTLLIFLCCVIAPLGTLGTVVAEEAVNVYTVLTHDSSVIDRITTLATAQLDHFNIDPVDAKESLVTYGKSAASWLSSQAFQFGTATLVTLVKTIVMLYLLFFLLRDGTRLMRFVQYMLPIGKDREDTLFTTFTSITRSIFKGTVVVALVQGIIGGLLFAIAGVPHFLLATSVMTLLACIPGVGPALVWLPAGIALIALGNTSGGFLILIGGGLIISLVDNLLRPLLVGRETRLPDPVIFISILGGIATFGIPGVILGPVAAGLCLALLQMFSDEYGAELERH